MSGAHVPLEAVAAPLGSPEAVRFAAPDGYSLAASVYEPAHARATVLIASATAVRRRYYDPFARWLTSRGLRVVTFDYRGIGDSRPASLRGFEARMRDWGEQDLRGAIAWAGDRYAETPLLLVAHSVGGQLIGLAANSDRVEAALTVGAQSGYWRHWPARAQPRMALNWHVLIPGAARAFGYVPAWLGIGEDLPGGVAREWAAWGRQPDYLLADHPERRAAFARFSRPMLAFSFADDPYAPRAAVAALLAFYPGAPTEHVHMAPRDLEARAIAHFGFFRERFRDSLWTRAADWLEQWISR